MNEANDRTERARRDKDRLTAEGPRSDDEMMEYIVRKGDTPDVHIEMMHSIMAATER